MPSGIGLTGFADVAEALSYEPVGDIHRSVGTDASYAVHVEFGTKHMQAQPYMRPAFERVLRDFDNYAEEADSAEELVDELAKAVRDEAQDIVPVDTGNLRDSIEVRRG